jgi:hypothetical protein
MLIGARKKATDVIPCLPASLTYYKFLFNPVPRSLLQHQVFLANFPRENHVEDNSALSSTWRGARLIACFNNYPAGRRV